MRISDMFAALDPNEMDYICELCAADADEDKENHKRQYLPGRWKTNTKKMKM